MLWKWGDGNQSDPAPLPFAGPGTWSTTYQYSAAGDHTVQLVIYNLASSVTFTVSVSYCSLALIFYSLYSYEIHR